MYNLKLSFRNLKKNKFYSILNNLGFAIGFTVCLFISLLVYEELTVDSGFVNHQRIFRLIDAENNNCNLDIELSKVLEDQYPDVERACPLEYHTGREVPIISKDHSKFVNSIASTTNQFFEVFSVDLVREGDLPFTNDNSVVITESLSKILFPDEDPIGKTINIANFFDATISGIIKKFPSNTSFRSEIFLNADNKNFQLAKNCNNGDCYTPTNHYILLQKESDVNEFKEKLNSTIGKYQKRVNEFDLQKLTDIYFSDKINGSENTAGNKAMVWMFVGIGLLIIILSCINYFNYTISIYQKRLKETGIKKVNGASVSYFALYYFIQEGLGVLFPFLLSILIAIVSLPFVSNLLQKDLNIYQLLDPRLVLIFLAIMIGVIIINVLASLFILTRSDIKTFLSNSASSGGKKKNFGFLTVFQFAASILLIVVMLTIHKQISFVKHSELGFNNEQVVRLNLPFRFSQTAAFKNEIKSLSFVQNASLSIGSPGKLVNLDGSGTGENGFYLNTFLIDEDFIDVFDLKLTDGRMLEKSDIDKSCVLNEAAIKRYGWESIENKRFNNRNRNGLQVVGVVKDFHIASLHSSIEPVCLVPRKEKELTDLSIQITPGDIGEKMLSLRKIWNSFVPNSPMDYTFYDTYFDSLYKKEERLVKTFGILSIIAIIITCMGILGQIFQNCINRTKEIGIRKVNGAKVSEILAMLNKDFVKWVVIAFVIATPIAWYAMHKWLENFAYKTTLNWWIFALAGVLALGIALLTVSWQSWRAATRNPVEALRYE